LTSLGWWVAAGLRVGVRPGAVVPRPMV